MTQRKTLVLHIGTHKTGTTYIQNVLARNADRLLKAGILYPKSGRIHNAHFKLCWQLRHADFKGAALDAIPEWRGMMDEFRTSKAEIAIVSAEEFAFSIPPKRLADLKAHFDVRVVCFVRSPDTFVQSFYNQFVKDFSTRETRTLTQYLAEENPFFLANRPMLEKWIDVFGRPAVTVHSFEEATRTGELFGAFFKALELQVPPGLQSPSVDILQKVSLPPDALEYLRLSNPYLTKEQGHHGFVVDLVKVVQDHKEKFQTTRSGVLSLASRQMLRERFAPQNTWLAKTFWGQQKNPYPVSQAARPAGDFDTQPEEADVHTLSRVSVLLRELMKKNA
ncbi:hypothetical protein [uncultured Tateyamaria sp.]|uniref:hypothetical protein n=1 Tax=uncultured Tateyamaria sp. TaxID=455651 RepID=UPI0026087474|nr:hypothetical protein [uncultured Tateyamaria sp.]